jgi:alkylhydroperoxidase/carboxymuconolactone decarboxylase family protein YurZ
MQTVNDITMVAPALDKYAQGALAELWKRPGLTPRDRGIVTIAALIARDQTIEMRYYFNLALDNGVKPREISEIITHLAFHSGWVNAMSAVPVAKDVFADRKIGTDQLPPASPVLLPLNNDAEANIVQHTTDVLFRDLWLRPDLVSESRHCQRRECFRPGCPGTLPPQSGDGQRPDSGTGRSGRYSFGLLRRLAECLFRATGRQGCLRETFAVAL